MTINDLLKTYGSDYLSLIVKSNEGIVIFKNVFVHDLIFKPDYLKIEDKPIKSWEMIGFITMYIELD